MTTYYVWGKFEEELKLLGTFQSTGKVLREVILMAKAIAKPFGKWADYVVNDDQNFPQTLKNHKEVNRFSLYGNFTNMEVEDFMRDVKLA